MTSTAAAPIASMTGFGRADGTLADPPLSWTVELRSVNGKGLDLRLRLPPGWDGLEPQIRTLLQHRFGRGSIAVTITAALSGGAAAARINRAWLDQLVALSRALQPAGAPLDIATLLTVRGVVEAGEDSLEDEAARGRREAAVLASVGDAAEALARARAEEGARLAVVIAGLVDAIAALAQEARGLDALRPAALRAKLDAALAEIVDRQIGADPGRLEQELALLLVKGDIREELDRLDGHCAAARALLADGGAVGRRFDFLCQEFNREANTLCAKSADRTLTRIGLDLKTHVDRLREQVQNLE